MCHSATVYAMNAYLHEHPTPDLPECSACAVSALALSGQRRVMDALLSQAANEEFELSSDGSTNTLELDDTASPTSRQGHRHSATMSQSVQEVRLGSGTGPCTSLPRWFCTRTLAFGTEPLRACHNVPARQLTFAPLCGARCARVPVPVSWWGFFQSYQRLGCPDEKEVPTHTHTHTHQPFLNELGFGGVLSTTVPRRALRLCCAGNVA